VCDYCRIVGITDYETMFVDAIDSMKKDITGLTAVQTITLRPRKGAGVDEAGVDVHYLTDFARGKMLSVGVMVT